VFQETRRKALTAMPSDAPLSQWLPFFEDERQKAFAYSSGVYPELDAINARPSELVPLLRSRDGNVMRRAVFAAAALDPVPAALIEPLVSAGRHVIELIQVARAGALPGDPDLAAEDVAYSFFFYWQLAMEHCGVAAKEQYRGMLQEIGREVGGSSNAPDGGFALIAQLTQKALEKLGPAGQ
jgi:hypothetical protein